MTSAVQPEVTTQQGRFTEEVRQTRSAMRLSLVFGALMLFGKGGAFLLTGSAAILSDAGESVIHVVAAWSPFPAGRVSPR